MENAPDELIPEKLRARFQSGTAPFLESGETVEVAVTALPMPARVYVGLMVLVVPPIAMLPYAIQKNASIVLTDRNVYVMDHGFNSFKPKRVLFKAPRGGYDAEVGGGGAGPFLRVGEHKIWIPMGKRIRARADAIVAAASAAAPAALPAGEGAI